MAIIYDNERGWFIWSHSVDVCRKQCTLSSNTTDPTTLPFQKLSLKLWRHTALERVQHLSTYLLKGYLRRTWMHMGIIKCVTALPTVQWHCVRQRSQPPVFTCTSNCRSVAGISTCFTLSSTVSVLLHFGTVISTAAWAASVAKWQSIGTAENSCI